MNHFYRFVAGGSRVTPPGIALAVAAALTLRHSLPWEIAPLFLAILLLTLAATAFEPIR